MSEQRREIRISVRGLEPGMFVSRLDRPWIDTPFPLQGIKLCDDDEIRNLQGICSYVYIDLASGKSPDPRYLEFDEPEVKKPPPGNEYAQMRRTEWALETDFNTELAHAESAHDALEQGIDEVMSDLKDGRHIDLRKLKHGVDAMIDSILRNPAAFSWLKEIKRRDNYSYQHAMGCAIWAASFGRHLGLEKHQLQELALGGLFCDVGKTRMPVELLAKHGSLTDEEVELIHRHVEHSMEIVERTPGISPRIVEMVATHHERHDGSGYPHGLAGNAIPIFGRVMGLVDSYDAMTCIRPYAPSRAPHQAVALLYDERDRKFQAELIEQFIQTCGIYPTGTLVELSNGEVGVITEVHSLKRLRPRVLVLLGADKRPIGQFRAIDLSQVETDANGNPLSVKCGLPVGAFGIDPKELFLD